MSEQSKQAYSERLAELRRATQVALSDAAYTTRCAHFAKANEEEAATQAYTNLWADLLTVLIAHADCDHAELLGIVAGTLQMRIPIVGTVSGPDARVSWNSGAGGLL